ATPRISLSAFSARSTPRMTSMIPRITEPSAVHALPALRRLAGSGRVWERVAAAEALWRIDGDPAPVLPVFRAAWSENPYTRGAIAGCLAGMGPAGAPLRDLVTAELAGPRRHTARPGGYGSHDIAQDERLLADCRRALARQAR
ncbi:HEAT repeat domain-containing protein, partial [Streptomyces sp. NPDC001833]